MDKLRITAIVNSGSQKGLSYFFSKPEVKVGRRRDCELVLTDSTVSSLHAVFTVSDEGVVVIDKDSTNGTRVNGKAVTRAALKHNDQVSFGKVNILVCIEEEAETRAVVNKGRGGKQIERLLLVGFPEEPKNHIIECLNASGIISQILTLNTGEELLMEMTHSLHAGNMPDVVIINLKIPIINGINTAISMRALEHGYKSTTRVPIVFFFNPPQAESFKKALQFCQPSLHVPTGADFEQFKKQTDILVGQLKTKFKAR